MVKPLWQRAKRGGMNLALYDELVPWYALLDPLADHEPEVRVYDAELRRLLRSGAGSLLELGSGAGHNAFYFKRSFTCTLSDVSPAMLSLSRQLNPECEHVLGDMRSLRLNRQFDAVFVHDAICYMASRADLRAAAETAFVHTRPGGAAIFAPDTVRESFAEYADLHEGIDGQRALRCLEWSWDPDPTDDCYAVEYAFLLREGTDIRAVHDRHIEGLFSTAIWLEILGSVGYRVEVRQRPLGEATEHEGYTDQIFMCHRPHAEG